MALADIPTGGQPRRLDSWKEIAEYLGRDVRTATRWEAEGMPLYRVPGGKGRSVFAFTNEIDAWMAGGRKPAETRSAIPPPDPTPAPRNTTKGRTLAGAGIAGALVTALAGAGVLTRGGAQDLDAATLRVQVSRTDVMLADASGVSRTIHRFAPAIGVPVDVRPPQVSDVDGDDVPDVLVGVSFYQDPAKRAVRSGELLNLATSGAVRWRFAFDDVLTFGDGQRDGPWALADWQSAGAGPDARFAVAAHDYTWWASLVAILDRDGRRLSTFAHPGWVESVLWIGEDRLAVAGFNNARDEAMLAVLDVRDASGQAPGTAGTPFACVSCPPTAPLFYATFARSELNRVTASRFNRAAVSIVGDQILVTTSETGRERSETTAIYEFDRALRFVRARYSERYWDEHGRLEREGRVTHPGAACPDRDGPPAIHVWADSAWLRVTPR